MSSHLTPQQMLAYIDGELSKGETRRADEHLHSCWTCLTEVERLKGDIATILDAQNESFTPGLPPPPQPWPTLHSVLARNLPEPPVSLWTRFGAHLHGFLNPVRVVAVSGILTAVLISGYAWFHSKPVSAKEILQRVQVADARRSIITSDQVIRERVHIRKTRRGQDRAKSGSVDTWKSPATTYWNVGGADSVASDLKAQYQAHAIPMSLPLSIAAIDAWGKAIGGSPSASREGGEVDVTYVGSSSGAKAAIERLSFAVEPETWQVRQMTLDFADASFEITEDDYAVISKKDVPSELLAHLEVLPPATVERGERVNVAALRSAVHRPLVNLDKAALDVYATLHSMNADLGEPVTVTRTSQAIEVGMWDLSPERQNELSAALAGKEGVQVVLTAPEIATQSKAAPITRRPASAADSAPIHVETESSGEDRRLQTFFGNAEKEQNFTNEALYTSTSILSHLYALRNLQNQFSADRSQSLSFDEQVQLRSLVRDHVAVVSADVEALNKQLSPLYTRFNLSPCAPAGISTAGNWQDESLQALGTGRNIDHLLRAMLTTTQTPAAPESALPQIDQNLCTIRVALKNLSSATD